MATSRREAVETLGEGQAAMGALLGRLPERELLRPEAIGGTAWSAKDLLCHLTFWEQVALGSLAEWREGKRPRIEEVFEADDVDRLNGENFERTRDLPLADARSAADQTHRELVAVIEAMSDEEWRAKAPYETERRGRLETLLGSILGAPRRPFGHAFAHVPDLEAFVRSIE